VSRRHTVGKAADLRPGDRLIVDIAGRSIGIFNVRGEFYAVRNQCPHQGAPLAQGVLSGTCLPSAPGEFVYARDGEILRCPWHAWEFDLTNGRSIHNPHRCRVRSYEVREADEEDESVDTYEVRVEAGDLILYM
jgi:3-phenylpropionate/trans-cinnamate dioxygenase ferredoxin subunit